MQSVHESKKYGCNVCVKSYSRLDQLKAHKNKCHK